MCCKFPRGKFHTHAANITPQLNACSSCVKQYFPFLLGGENIFLLHPLPVLVVLKILREILSFTRSLVINTRQLVGSLENSDSKSKTLLCDTADCFKASCLLFVDTMSYMRMYLVLQRDSRFESRNCHATHIALTERLGSNGFQIIFSDKIGL